MLDLAFAAADGGQRDDTGRLVRTWSDDTGQVFARGFSAGQSGRIEWPGLGAFVFTRNSPAVVLESLPAVDRLVADDIFRRIVQPIILQAQGYETLHASAVAGPSGAIAFCGLSGSGKSTFAWALGRRSGFRQLADDALVLSGFDDAAPDGGVVLACPVAFRPRLRESADAFFGRPATDGQPASAAVPLRAIVLLHPDTDAPAAGRLHRLPAAAAFPAVLTHAYCFDEADRTEARRLARHYLSLAACTPVFDLRYRQGLEQLDGLLDSLLSTVPASPVAS